MRNSLLIYFLLVLESM